jgi:hypothetical protein
MIFPLEMGMSFLYGWSAFATTLSVFGRSVFDRPYLLGTPQRKNKMGMEVLKAITTFPVLAVTGFHTHKMNCILVAMTVASGHVFSILTCISYIT